MDMDVAIVGAGLSGLAAGIRLAHYGKKVTIFERHTVAGGLNSYYRRRGHEFDVGLHAMTNMTSPQARSAPLNRLLRQLRLRFDDLDLVPQGYSLIRFPGTDLRFSNDIALLESEICRGFPGREDGFRRLVRTVEAHDALSFAADTTQSARRILGEHLGDPLLVDMLLCPLMYYGNPREHDMDFTTFSIMFRSVYQEGFCRPRRGMRPVVEMLQQRYLDSGGNLRLGCGVRKLRLAGDRVEGVELDDGSLVRAGSVLSCAGCLETLRLCDPVPAEASTHPEGWFTVTELTAVLDRSPRDLGWTPAITFFSRTPRFRFQRPTEPVDPSSGVVCAPAGFDLEPGNPAQRLLRLTLTADPAYWTGLSALEYRQAKTDLAAAMVAVLASHIPGVDAAVRYADVFTPRSIARYTGHLNGAVYGSPMKRRDGKTPVANLFLCGTDQGFLGIVGSMLSGVSIANAYLVR